MQHNVMQSADGSTFALANQEIRSKFPINLILKPYKITKKYWFLNVHNNEKL